MIIFASQCYAVGQCYGTHLAELYNQCKKAKMNDEWNALYLKPRTEKKVAERLSRKGFDVYLPLCTVRKQYSDRWKNVEEPLLKSYLFVAAEANKNPEVLRTEGVLNYVQSSSSTKIAVIKKQELMAIREYLQQKVFEETEWDQLRIGDQRVLKNAAFEGKQAQIIEIKKNTIKLVIEDLGFIWEVSR